MNASKRVILEIALVIIGLCGCAAWSASRLAESRRAARAAVDDLGACRHLAERIEAMRRQPAVAGVEERHRAETATQIEKAVTAAGIPASASLLSISPEPPRRLNDSAYKEAPTQILLRDLTLRQLVTFLSHLTEGPAGLRARSLRVSAPREDTGDRWSAEVTVYYLIYSPRSQSERGG